MLRKTVIPIPPATKTSGRDGSSGSANLPFGGSTSTSLPTGSSRSVRLKALSRMRVAKPSTPFSFGEVTTVMCRRSPLSSSSPTLGERDEEVLPGPEVHLFAEEVEGHEQRSLRDFLLFLDLSSHAYVLSVDEFASPFSQLVSRRAPVLTVGVR